MENFLVGQASVGLNSTISLDDLFLSEAKFTQVVCVYLKFSSSCNAASRDLRCLLRVEVSKHMLYKIVWYKGKKPESCFWEFKVCRSCM